jgi:hypothetical protein
MTPPAPAAGWDAKTTPEREAIREAIAWLRKHGERERHPTLIDCADKMARLLTENDHLARATAQNAVRRAVLVALRGGAELVEDAMALEACCGRTEGKAVSDRVLDPAMRERVTQHRREIALRPKHLWDGLGYAKCIYCGAVWYRAVEADFCRARAVAQPAGEARDG